MAAPLTNPHFQTRVSRSWLRSGGHVVVTCSVFVILSGLVVSLGCNGPEAAGENETSEAAPRVLSVNVLLAERADSHTEQRSYSGLIKAERAVDLSFSRPARLERLLVDHGDVVKAGQVLAELDKRHLDLKKESLTSAHEEARLALAKLLADPRLQNSIALRQSITELRRELNELKTQLADEADAPPATASRLQSAQRNLDTLDALTRQQVESQTKVVADLQGQLAEVDLELEQSTLLAPFDGVIALKHVGAADLVAPSRPVLRIVDQTKLTGWVAVPMAVASEFSRGQEYELVVDSTPYPAQVLTVLPEVDRSTRSRTVILTFDEATSLQLSPGEMFQLALPRDVQGSGYWLPLAALTRQTRGLWSVFVVEEDESGMHRVARRYVEVIHLDGENAWVRGMLDDGERIVANGTHRIVEGQRVKAEHAAHEFGEPPSAEEVRP